MFIQISKNFLKFFNIFKIAYSILEFKFFLKFS